MIFLTSCLPSFNVTASVMGNSGPQRSVPFCEHFLGTLGSAFSLSTSTGGTVPFAAAYHVPVKILQRFDSGQPLLVSLTAHLMTSAPDSLLLNHFVFSIVRLRIRRLGLHIVLSVSYHLQ